MVVLGIESSCDETSAAVVSPAGVLSSIVSSQCCHTAFGGVVPELASREHERLIAEIVEAALIEANITKNEVELIAATAGPGLIGAVMVGLSFGQAMAWALQRPFMPVNHIEGHIFSPFIEHDGEHRPPSADFVSLTVSGGHTLLSVVREDLSYEVVGRTIDDAAGEAFDKTGKMLGLPYPAGPEIDRLAAGGDPGFHRFPRALTASSQTSKSYRGNSDFSFSGLKTSVRTWLQKQEPAFIEKHLADIAASIQAAIVDVLVDKTVALARSRGIGAVAIAGGVSANSGLRRAMQEAAAKHGLEVHIPSPRYSTDNAAMIATLASLKVARGTPTSCRYDAAPFASFSAPSGAA